MWAKEAKTVDLRFDHIDLIFSHTRIEHTTKASFCQEETAYILQFIHIFPGFFKKMPGIFSLFGKSFP